MFGQFDYIQIQVSVDFESDASETLEKMTEYKIPESHKNKCIFICINQIIFYLQIKRRLK